MIDKAPSNWQEIAGHKRELFNIVVQFTNDKECLDVMDKINDVTESMCDERIKEERERILKAFPSHEYPEISKIIIEGE